MIAVCIVSRGKKKVFFRVLQNLLKYKFLLQNLYPFWFYLVLNITFLKETKVYMENPVIFGPFFLIFPILNKIQLYNIIQYNHIKCDASF